MIGIETDGAREAEIEAEIGIETEIVTGREVAAGAVGEIRGENRGY